MEKPISAVAHKSSSDRLRLRHVDAGVFQEIERPLRAAAFEEREVVVQLLLAAADDALAEGDRGRQAGGVFVDVERVVEVRDAQAFELELFVDDEIGAEVVGQQLAVFGF